MVDGLTNRQMSCNNYILLRSTNTTYCNIHEAHVYYYRRSELSDLRVTRRPIPCNPMHQCATEVTVFVIRFSPTSTEANSRILTRLNLELYAIYFFSTGLFGVA